MKQRTAIILATALTAFMLVVIGSIAWSVSTKSVAQQLAPALEPTQVVEIKPTSTTAPTNVPSPVPTQPRLVSAEHAVRVARQLMPGSALQQTPELVNYRGKMAYEVMLSAGVVYVDAFTGHVLGSAAAVVANDGGVTNGGGNDGGTGGGAVESSGENTAQTNLPPQSSGNPPESHEEQEQQEYQEHENDEHSEKEEHQEQDRDEHEDKEHEGGEHEDKEHEGGEHEDGD